ncbi:hypothetical protein CI109_106705 [Kwoniella shandongensis]|uniref:Uncharacterized protein n=1 Tax=Kwoniella shandongensis TaxID=1734106 RepID=A0A5M6C6W9_9TREE|nr:uncharacterized protein CI109_001038 [Kwoniella shandongensis]KAA5530858.1 hypothetical protein CI109_001038 [Kwoniella shandongensis]
MLAFALFSLLPLCASAATLATFHDVPLAPSPLPAPGGRSNADAIVSAFGDLSRNTKWNLIKSIPLEGDVGEVESMVRINDDRFVLAWGNWTVPTKAYGKDAQGNTIYINGTDRTPGQGISHLTVFDGNGTRLATATLNDVDATEYHVGGMDYDGEYLWTELAQYRPNSTATAIRVDPYTYDVTPIVHINDHSGGIIHDTKKRTITMLNWGSRNASRFGLDSHDFYRQPKAVFPNPSSFVDYQDCKWLGYPTKWDRKKSVALCSGVAVYQFGDKITELGGIALVDVDTMVPLIEVPMNLLTPAGLSMNQNPVDVDVVDGKMRLFFAPDLQNGTIFVYESV